MTIVFFGTSAFGLPSLEALEKSGHTLLQVITTPDKPQGRKLKVCLSPVKRWAESRRKPVLEATDVHSAGFLSQLESLKPDLLVVISFGLILPAAVLKASKLMALNVHSSLLPRFRGAAPIHRALIEGEPETGVTVMRMTERLDAGDIILQKKTAIRPEDDFISLEERLARLGSEALLEAIAAIEQGRAHFVPQDESRATVAKKISKDDGRIVWKKNAVQIINQLRAFRLWPTAFTFYDGKRLLLEEADVAHLALPKNTKPGTILEASKDRGLCVAALDSVLQIKKLKLEGRKSLSARDFLNGFPLKPGAVLE